METRRLGSLSVSVLGLGSMGMSAFYGTGKDVESVAVNHGAIEPGGTFPHPADGVSINR